jgi:hypothetical protein
LNERRGAVTATSGNPKFWLRAALDLNKMNSTLESFGHGSPYATNSPGIRAVQRQISRRVDLFLGGFNEFTAYFYFLVA